MAAAHTSDALSDTLFAVPCIDFGAMMFSKLVWIGQNLCASPRRREKLAGGWGELEYAFLFEPAKAAFGGAKAKVLYEPAV